MPSASLVLTDPLLWALRRAGSCLPVKFLVPIHRRERCSSPQACLAPCRPFSCPLPPLPPSPISELAALPGLLSVLPSTCQGLAQGHCGNSILGCLAAAAATATTLSAAGFLFHSLLFLGILCSIKPFACNTAGSPPSHPLLRSFLLLPPLLAPWASPCLPFLPTASPQTSVGVEPPGLSDSSLSPLGQRCAEKAPPFPPPSRKVQAEPQGPHGGSPPTTPGQAGGPALPVESGCPTGSPGFSGQPWERLVLRRALGHNYFSS